MALLPVSTTSTATTLGAHPACPGVLTEVQAHPICAERSHLAPLHKVGTVRTLVAFCQHVSQNVSAHFPPSMCKSFHVPSLFFHPIPSTFLLVPSSSPFPSPLFNSISVNTFVTVCIRMKSRRTIDSTYTPNTCTCRCEQRGTDFQSTQDHFLRLFTKGANSGQCRRHFPWTQQALPPHWAHILRALACSQKSRHVKMSRMDSRPSSLRKKQKRSRSRRHWACPFIGSTPAFCQCQGGRSTSSTTWDESTLCTSAKHSRQHGARRRTTPAVASWAGTAACWTRRSHVCVASPSEPQHALPEPFTALHRHVLPSSRLVQGCECDPVALTRS